MLDNWYTLRALTAQWNATAIGARITDVYSGRRDELTIATDTAGAFRISVQPGDRYLFRQDAAARPRRNVVSLFESAVGRGIETIRVADRDRVLDLLLSGGWMIRVVLFGPATNIFLSEGSRVQSAFRKAAAGAASLPEPQPAVRIETADAFAARWPKGAMEPARALARALPLVDRAMASEIIVRSGVAAVDACLLSRAELDRLFEASRAFADALTNPDPRVYRNGRHPVAFSLVPLTNPPAADEASYSSLDEAVRAYVKARLGDAAFLSEFTPMVRAAEASVLKNRSRADRMRDELAKPSRAERYERFGHLLMADPAAVLSGADRVQIADLFAGGAPVTIALDPSQSAVENAERYYAKARRTRKSRETAHARLVDVARRLRDAEAFLGALGSISDRTGLRALRQEYPQMLGTTAANAPEVPFRRFDLGGGYEVWVGRNAKQNDALTFKHARKHDYWLHARGVAGSHTVLRRPSKTERAPASILEAAAGIAAYHSKARGSALVPVILTERKFVRKARKGPPGAVLVEREEVLIVPPGLPPGERDL